MTCALLTLTHDLSFQAILMAAFIIALSIGGGLGWLIGKHLSQER